jgi:hypothetical protein
LNARIAVWSSVADFALRASGVVSASGAVGEDVRAQRAGDCAVESEGISRALAAGSACVVLAARCARSRVGTGGAEQTGVSARAAGHSVDRQVMVRSTAAAEAAIVALRTDITSTACETNRANITV